jgi:hypothetical protein
VSETIITVRGMVMIYPNQPVLLMKEVMIRGRVGKINQADNMVKTTGISKQEKVRFHFSFMLRCYPGRPDSRILVPADITTLE